MLHIRWALPQKATNPPTTGGRHRDPGRCPNGEIGREIKGRSGLGTWTHACRANILYVARKHGVLEHLPVTYVVSIDSLDRRQRKQPFLFFSLLAVWPLLACFASFTMFCFSSCFPFLFFSASPQLRLPWFLLFAFCVLPIALSN